MSQPLIFCRPDNSYQSPFMSNPFMQNQYPQYKPIAPRRRHRKRKLEETDICDTISIIDNDDDKQHQSSDKYLTFIKPSNKRRRTNEMHYKSNKQTIILQPELESNIYTNPLQSNKNKNTNNKNNTNMDNNDANRSEAPYNHLIHPYLRNKNKNKNKNKGKEEANSSDDENDNKRDESPEYMFSKLNLNSFKMKNKQNESVNDWKQSIELQLNNARNKPSNIQSICQRINNTNGLGRDILMAKLRKELPNKEFIQICHIMRINPNLR